MSKRLILILSLLAVLILTLAACGQEAATPAPAEEPAEEQAVEEPAEQAAEEPAEEEAMEEEAMEEMALHALPGGFLEQAMAGDFAGTTVIVDGPFVDTDEVKFNQSMEAFEEATGIDVQYIGSKEFEASISVRVDGGDPPDIADFPQPGLAASFVQSGDLIDVSTFIDEDWLQQQYNQSWLDMATMEGPDGPIMAGAWNRYFGKSIVYYPLEPFEASGYEVPETWDEMMALTQQIADDGDAAWCIGIESGAGTGWVATDWTEELMLRTTSLENYDAWTVGSLPFQSPEVKGAIETWSDIWFNDDYVLGGTKSIVTTSFGDAPVPMFDDPPRCWLHKQGNFIVSFFPEGVEYGKDYGFFYLPPKGDEYGKPWLVAGDLMAMFNDRPEVRAAMEYITMPESAIGWLEQGGALAAHKTATPDMYGQDIERGIAELVQDATTFRFDASDLMPGEVGAGSFWKGMTDYVSGAADIDTVLSEIDDSWPAGVAGQSSAGVGEEDEEMEPVEIDPVRVAIVMPSTTTDLAWSQSLYDSLVQLQEAAGGEDVVEIAFTENMFNVTDAAAAIRDYADTGYNIVIAHGAQYGSSLFEIAPDFPDTSFAWGTTTNTGVDEGVTNVFAYEPRGDEGGYIMGVLAANLTDAGIIGLVGPVDAGDAKLHVDGFVAGVRDTDPDIQVNVSFTGSFGDTALAAEAANTHIQAGADVLTGSSQQIVGAVGAAKDNGIPWLGFQADQSSLAPEIVVGTVLYDWNPVLLEIIKSHQSGDMGGKVLQLTLANGGQVPVYADSLPAEAVEAAEKAVEDIVNGSIEIVPEPR